MDTHADDRAIVYEGRAGEYIGLAAKNLLLTIITLGIYRFWAKAATRRHLWERTRVLGDALEYRGTGLQLFLGALIAFFVILLPLTLVSIPLQSLVMRGEYALAVPLYALLVTALVYIIGAGTYRSWRYLLAQTRWRGIRGGMAEGGWRYGWLYLRMTLLQSVTLGVTAPYTSVRLHNALWNDASFGSTPFTAAARWRPLMRRFLPVWGISTIVVGGFYALMFSRFTAMADLGPDASPAETLRLFATIYIGLIAIGFLLGLLWVTYLAAYWREVLGATALNGFAFGFDASAGTWLRYQLTNIAILIGTLGLGFIVLPYRQFTFFAKYVAPSGALDTAAMAQSELTAPGQGDGIADAFDLAAV